MQAEDGWDRLKQRSDEAETVMLAGTDGMRSGQGLGAIVGKVRFQVVGDLGSGSLENVCADNVL